ncbi:NAD(P)-dependent oxidoreductase [Nocardiopsis sediminis]|uniref:NAD(P)-dependent oxidoreductase n=1 Tax=Nocardiopsis sediminis TaxID=1778267 RepID=A0ABV8FMR5_9ACTN
MKVLTAGDHFVLNSLLAGALRARVDAPLELSEVTLPWPLTPFGRVAEVDEASDAEDELIAALPGVEVAITQMGPFTERVLDAADALKLIVCCRGGPVNINTAAAAERGIAVVATPGRNAVAAAEHAVALLLAAMRAIPRTHAGVVAGEWRSDLYAFEECGRELGGATVGLVGYGAIGRRVARVLHAFDAHVLVADPYADPAAMDPFVEPVPLAELLPRADALSLHARLTPGTRGLIGAAEIAALPRGAVLVNTARGGLLDYGAVTGALASGHLAAAGFDVFPEEPLAADSPLRSSPNVVLTPHLAGATRQTAQRAATLAAEAVADFLAGRTPAGLVDTAAS